MYLALYRKYRPKTFDDVISQEHITTTLKNQISTGTTAHAYLFTGSRGTGKTSCAKILAMAVNCKNPRNGNPCLECESCREIESGAATDIVEMDAASNNGVDDVRQLRDEVNYTPVSCKYRVYIIDEVHMLSPAAFNALLKTLEEPPEHVKFVLATTELHKVLPTIISRCQRFDFRRIDVKESAARLLYVAKEEGFSLDDDAAELISRLSDGGMRDALSVLDRCASADSHVTTEVVRECAGVADNRHLFSFSEMIAKKDVAGCIRLLDELHRASKDIARIIDELSGHFRDLMLIKTIPSEKDLLSAMPYEYGEVERIAGMFSLDDILRCLSLLGQCADSIGKTKQRRTAAEMCLVRMCLGYSAASEESAHRPVMNVVAGAAPDGGAIQIIPIKEQKEEFIPTPVEKLSPKNAQTLSKLKELNRQTAEIVSGLAANTQANAFEQVPPEAPPFDAPPPEEPFGFEPPEPPVPPVPPEQNEPSKPEPQANSEPVEAVKPEQIEPAPPEQAEAESTEKRPALTSITAEQWNAAVEKLYPMNKALLTGSQAVLNAGLLEIHSTNALFSSVKDDSLRELSEEVSEALGADVKIKLVCEKKTAAEETEQSAVNALLKKAEALGIDVIRK